MSEALAAAAAHCGGPDDVDWRALSARRADVYAWFSALFAAELTDDGIAAYQRGDADALLEALDASGLSAEVRRLRAAVHAWEGTAFLRVELAADFAGLFLVDARDAALPYASAYLDPQGQLYGEPHQKMREFLLDSGLQVHSAFKEPSDHLAVILAYIETVIRTAENATAQERKSAAAAQAAFLAVSLLPWLSTFVLRCESLRKETMSDFYPAVAALLAAFVSEDAACLEAADTRP